MKIRFRIGIILAIVSTAILLLLTYFVGTESYRNLLFLWEETFRRNWSALTANLTDHEAFMKYILPLRTLRDFPIFQTYIIVILSISYWVKDKNNLNNIEFSKEDSFFEYFQKAHYKKITIMDFLLLFAMFYIIREILKLMQGFGFPYMYGPLFLVISIIFVILYFINEYKKYKNQVI